MLLRIPKCGTLEFINTTLQIILGILAIYPYTYLSIAPVALTSLALRYCFIPLSVLLSFALFNICISFSVETTCLRDYTSVS